MLKKGGGAPVGSLRTWALVIFLALFAVSCAASDFQMVDDGFPFAQAWSYSTGDMLFSYAVGEDWMVIATTEGLSALDAATGSLLWENDFLVNSGEASIAIFDDHLAAIGFEDNVKVFSISGDELSTFSLIDNFGTGSAQIAAISDPYVCVMRTSSWVLQTYDMNTGTLLWETYTSRGGPDVYIDTNLKSVLVVNSTEIRSYEIDRGALILELEGVTHASAYRSPMLYYYALDNDNEDARLVAFDVSHEAEIWRTLLYVDVKQLVLHQGIILASTPREILSYDLEQGDFLWAYFPGDTFSTPMLGIEDQLFARGAVSRTIYALSTEGLLVGTLQIGPSAPFVQPHDDYTASLYAAGDRLVFVFRDEIFVYEKK